MIWIFVAYNLDSSLCGTLFNVSKETLLRRSVLGENAKAKVSSLTGFSMTIVGMVVAVVLPIMIANGGGAHTWTFISGTLGAAGIIFLIIAFILMKEYTDEELIAAGVYTKKAEQKEKINVLTQLKTIFQNKYFIIYMGMYALYALVMGFSNVVGTYYFNTNIGNIEIMSIISLSGLASMPLFLVYPKMIEKLGARKFGMLCMIIGVCGYLLRGAAGANIPLLFIGNLLASFTMTAFSICHPIYLIQCMDFSVLKTGMRIETFYSSFTNALMKIFMGLSSLILGVILAIGKYDGSLEVQPQSAHTAIAFAYNTFPMICAILIFIFFMFFKVADENEKLRAK
ncbi:MAG: MFS transporter [Eubacterium sp.]|nr:MFS transporter [Eubacterium sp.]